MKSSTRAFRYKLSLFLGLSISLSLPLSLAQSIGDVEYTDCISTDTHNECPDKATKQSDGEASVMPELWGL